LPGELGRGARERLDLEGGGPRRVFGEEEVEKEDVEEA